MAVLKVEKVVSALPDTLVADTIYAVRVGAGFDLYITDSTGTTAHKVNAQDANPIGTVLTFAGGALQPGYKWTDGSALYSGPNNNWQLAEIIGQQYGYDDLDALTYSTSASSGTITTTSAHGKSVGDIIFLSGGDDFDGGNYHGISNANDGNITRPLWVLATPTTTTLQVADSPTSSTALTASTTQGGLTLRQRFRVPNLSDRFILTATKDGLGELTLGSISPGDTGGEENHLLTGAESGLKAHSHSVTDSAYDTRQAYGGGGKGARHATNNNTRTTSTVGDLDADEAHNNMPPWIAMHRIIRYE